MTVKKTRNNIFKEIEGSVKENKNLVKAYEKTLIEITTKLENEQKEENKDVLKVEYLKKENNTLINNISLLKTYVVLLEDVKEEIKKEEKVLFILGK